MPENLLNKQQLAIVEGLKKEPSTIVGLFSSSAEDELAIDSLVELLTVANALYRSGYPYFNDSEYDGFIAALEKREPGHSYLTSVEPEFLAESKTVQLPQKMLSTDKAYSFEEIKKWTDRLVKAANELGIAESEIEIRVTPKLDGYAAYDDGSKLYTRGDGFRGQDVTRAFYKGLQVANNGARGLGPGEIVIKKSYFDQELSVLFENSRNIQAAIIAEKKVDESKVKLIWSTPGYPDYNWSIRGDVDKQFGAGFLTKVQNAIINLNDEALLKNFSRKKFIKADNSMYQPIVDTGKKIGILD